MAVDTLRVMGVRARKGGTIIKNRAGNDEISS